NLLDFFFLCLDFLTKSFGKGGAPDQFLSQICRIPY
ncbi:hypothetical protein CMV_001240, partial [Castanea mollissima]